MRTLIQEQLLPVSMDIAWEFFATPKNLNEVTPSDMIFEIISYVPDKMYEGMMISYRIRPLLNIPFKWVTEITHIKEHQYFIDEQRIGPYKIWHHEHHFKPVEGGVMMTDILYYDIGKSIFGELAGLFFVHNRVKQIFAFRKEKLETIFNLR